MILVMSFEVDSEMLIDSIEERSFLWNLPSDTYKDKPRREKAWTEIGEQLVENNIDQSDKNKAEQETWRLVCTYQRLSNDRRKWRSLEKTLRVYAA